MTMSLMTNNDQGYALHHEIFERAEMEPTASSGAVVAMRPLTVHASSKSIDSQPRRVLHIEYAATVHLAATVELAVV